MADQLPIVRQWILLRTLCVRRLGATVGELADELDVSKKTIRRDLQTFQQVGFPLAEIIEERGRKKWRVDSDRAQLGMAFAFDEVIALYLGRRFLEPLAGTLYWEAAQRAFKKMRASFAPDALRYLEKFSGMFHATMVGVSNYAQKAELIDQLMIGIEDRRAVFITYRSLRATEQVTYDAYPYGLTYHRGSLYLVGRAPQHDAIRHWKVDRIEDAEVTAVHFQLPTDFDLQQHFAKSFGVFQGDGDVCVTVRFSPAVARYVQESKWHESQKLTVEPDGGLLATFHLDGTEEIKRWIMTFGKHAVVLEPEKLLEELVVEITAMLDSYLHGAALPATQR